MDILKNKRILALIGLICLFIGTITPYFQFELLGYKYSLKLWGYWEGKVIVVLIVLNTMFIFKDYLKKYLPQVFNSNLGQKIENANSKLSLIPTILVAIFVIYLTVTLDSDYLKHGLGFYILWLGIICLVGYAILYKKSNNSIETSQVAGQTISNPQPMNNLQSMSNSQPVNNQQFMNNSQPMNDQQPMINPQPMNNSQPNQPMNGQTENKKYCPQCNNIVDSTANYCFTCGHKF